MDRHAIAGIILASGLSRRFGAGNKLLLPIDGEPMVRRVADVYRGAGLEPVLVVVGYQSEQVASALAGVPVTIVSNPDYKAGQSRSLVRGMAALPYEIEAAVIGVGDQPWLTAEVIHCLIQAYRATNAPIVAPRYGANPGNPVLFARSLFAELLAVQGDQGGRPVLRAHQDEVVWVQIEDERVGEDIDIPPAPAQGDYRV